MREATAFLCLGGLLVNPADQLVLRDDHALADDQRGEALAVHQLIGFRPGEAQHRGHLFGAEGEGQLIEGSKFGILRVHGIILLMLIGFMR